MKLTNFFDGSLVIFPKKMPKYMNGLLLSFPLEFDDYPFKIERKPDEEAYEHEE